MSEIETLVSTLKSAKAAAMSNLHAIDAALSMLTNEEKSTQDDEANDTETEQPAPGCKHEKAITRETGAGTFRICSCGHQEQISE